MRCEYVHTYFHIYIEDSLTPRCPICNKSPGNDCFTAVMCQTSTSTAVVCNNCHGDREYVEDLAWATLCPATDLSLESNQSVVRLYHTILAIRNVVLAAILQHSYENLHLQNMGRESEICFWANRLDLAWKVCLHRPVDRSDA